MKLKLVGEIMAHHYKLNGIQWSGITLSVIGATLIAFPTLIGVLAIKFITLLLMIIGFYGLTFSLVMKSITTTFLSASLLLMSIYAFVNPDYILLIIGIAFALSGAHGLLLYSKRKSDNIILSSILMILLGVFAIVNSRAALATVMMILGIVILALGVILIYQGKLMKPLKKTFFYKYGANDPTQATSNPNKRVIINIDTDEVEEVDYKEIK
ncbi:DUF308 domain-containing protein [Fusibacter sp. 3D3]|uniref:DUF308 domain-containing protein n=1 Tax=Fusibacter sp. 3D3 TaxID=1048380 RepID=UPI000853985C|nr:DUF308 domain-containing protein [Fusibacter sp. 3D3]GAU78734.1 hypothetical protein F3D3_3369 [Fusibacter sp. 3D3]